MEKSCFIRKTGAGRVGLARRLAAALLLVEPGGAMAATVFVATNGSDLASGESWAAAVASVSNAVRLTGDGLATNTVVISNGAYIVSEYVTITNPITVRGLSGNPADVVLDCNYPVTTNRAIYINHSDAVVAGLTVPTAAALRLKAAGWLSARGCLQTVSSPAAGRSAPFRAGGFILLAEKFKTAPFAATPMRPPPAAAASISMAAWSAIVRLPITSADMAAAGFIFPGARSGTA